MDVLFLHGFTHTGASWDGVRAELPQSYRALCPDLRGHGAAATREPVTLPAVLDDLCALAPSEPFVLCGYSMGGRIALHLALALEDRVARLVLVGASPGLASADEREARREADLRLADEIERMSIEEFAHRWARSTPVLAGQPAHVLASVQEDRLRNTPAGLARALRGLGTGALPPLWDRLGSLELPTVLMVGERDAKFKGIASEMALRLPRAGIEEVPGCGHAVHLEAPEQIAAGILGPKW